MAPRKIVGILSLIVGFACTAVLSLTEPLKRATESNPFWLTVTVGGLFTFWVFTTILIHFALMSNRITAPSFVALSTILFMACVVVSFIFGIETGVEFHLYQLIVGCSFLLMWLIVNVLSCFYWGYKECDRQKPINPLSDLTPF